MRSRWKLVSRERGAGKAAGRRITRNHAETIRSLVGAGRTASAQALFPGEPKSERPAMVEQADEVLFDLGAAIEFILDDGVEEPADEAWESAKDRATDDDTLATKIQALEDYAQIGEELLDRLKELGDFKPEWIALSRNLATKLSAGGPAKRGVSASAEIDLRNRIFVLLEEKIDDVRAAAKYVYRRHPEVLREVTSQYERRRRLELRRRKLREAAEGGQPQG